MIGAGAILAFTLIEVSVLNSSKHPIYVSRRLRSNLSLGDEEPMVHTLRNNLTIPIRFKLYDSLPQELQMRGFKLTGNLTKSQKISIKTIIVPKIRGEYHFKFIDVYLATGFGFIQRRVSLEQDFLAKVYPSVIQLKKYSLNNIKNSVLFYGVKKVRKIGHSYDFDHIKQYVVGDDVRSINWKATSRRNELMINHYEDEKSQAVYCVLDKSRVMNMPFNELSLLDYSINASLVVANSAIQHQDKIGLVTFSDVLGNVLPAGNNTNQLNKINETLYNQKHRDTEANYKLLYYSLKKLTRKRSLFFLFTNFESMPALDRQLDVILGIAKKHVLVVVMFKNTEVEKYYNDKIESKARVYEQAVAEKYLTEKLKIVKKIKSFGIRCIYTDPEKLTVNTLNQYIELKARGVI
jgi:uncharacterized protein (DUF58 family)